MIVKGFRADAHVSGGRIDITWEVHPEPGETLAERLPEVWLRRKKRDFAFPEVEGIDPFLIYDGARFAATCRLAPRYDIVDGLQMTERVEIDEGADVGHAAERVVRIYADASGVIQRLEVTIVDRGDDGAGLEPGVTYYYQIGGEAVPLGGNPEMTRAVAQATAPYGTGDDLYRRLPAIHQRFDEQGELRAFLSVIGAPFDLMRSLAEGLRHLHDVENCDYRLLPHMAHWLGWDLNYAAPIPIQRHEIKYAAALYRIIGTIPGCMIWVKRLTGWEARIKEFYKNVFFTNNVGNPDDPTDHGSRTVDTRDPERLKHVKRYEDDFDYTYDSGTGDAHWYAYNCVGIFVRPNPGEDVRTVLRKRANLVENLSIMLPVNIRGVIILETDTLTDAYGDSFEMGEDEHA